MTETSPIANIARFVFEDIFQHFGWTQSKGPSDHSWPCEKEDEHDTNKAHPTDAVFYYEDPYTKRHQYFNIDLKSYKKESIKYDAVNDAVISLTKAVDCAHISPNWRRLYINSAAEYDVHGLLFVYNHDNLYEGEFDRHLQRIDQEDVSMVDGLRVFIIDPRRVQFLSSVSDDIERAKLRAGRDGRFSFINPSTSRKKTTAVNSMAARIESILGAWIITHTVRHEPGLRESANGESVPYVLTNEEYTVYCYGTGASANEFSYLIDFLFRVQIAGQNNVTVNICSPFSHDQAPTNLEHAKNEYSKEYFAHLADSPIVKEIFNTIRWVPMSLVVKRFLSQEVGMGLRRKE